MLSAAVTGWVKFLASGHGGLIVWGSLVVAALLVAARWASIPEDYRLTDVLAEVGWSFNDSWATNLTALGGILGTLIGTSDILPKTATPLSSQAFTGLNLLFSLITLSAPLLFAASARLAKVEKDDTEPTYQGYVAAFLGAAGLTVWAVLGEVATSTLLLKELASGFLTDKLSGLFLIFLVFGIILSVVYSWRTSRAVIIFKSAKKPGRPHQKKRPTALLVASASTEAVAARPSKQQRWSLL